MKNNLMRFLVVFFLTAGIGQADAILEYMYKELTKGKESKQKPDSAAACTDNCLGGRKGSGGLGDNIDVRSGREIMEVVNENKPALNKLYREHLKQKSGLSGKVVLRFTIEASGKVANINIVSSTTKYAKFDNAIKDAVAAWKWKPIEKGNITTTIPFNFTDDSFDI